MGRENRFLYNQGTGDVTFNTERVRDLGVDWDMTKYRAYDYTLGRFLQVDPKADQGGQETLTPYQYGYNNPVRYSDPMGDCPKCWDNFMAGVMRFANMYSDGARSLAHDRRNAPPPSVQRVTGNRIIDAGIKLAGGDIFRAAGMGNPKADMQAIGIIALSLEGPGRVPIKKVPLSQIRRNAAKGAAFEINVVANRQKVQADVVEQITVKSNLSGTRTRIDVVGNERTTGLIALTEAKSSATAPLTKNQKVAFPEIEQAGGVVVGKGKAPFVGGTDIPPTPVKIFRPEDLISPPEK